MLLNGSIVNGDGATLGDGDIGDGNGLRDGDSDGDGLRDSDGDGLGDGDGDGLRDDDGDGEGLGDDGTSVSISTY